MRLNEYNDMASQTSIDTYYIVDRSNHAVINCSYNFSTIQVNSTNNTIDSFRLILKTGKNKVAIQIYFLNT